MITSDLVYENLVSNLNLKSNNLISLDDIPVLNVPADEYEELSKLTISQKNFMITIEENFPKFLRHQPVIISTSDLGKLWNIDTNRVLEYLNRIVGKSRFTYKIVENKQKSSSSILEIFLP